MRRTFALALGGIAGDPRCRWRALYWCCEGITESLCQRKSWAVRREQVDVRKSNPDRGSVDL